MELLIAVSLVSLLSVGILMAMRVGLNAMEKVNDRLLGNRRVSGAERILERQVAGLIATTANCRADPGAAPDRRPFFQGEPQSMRFVSSYSLEEASRGYPRIVEYQVWPRDDGQGVRLVVNELYWTGPDAAGALCLGPAPEGMGTLFRPIAVGPRSFVLADRLAVCRFAYQETVPPPVRKAWVPVWTRRELPEAIRIEMAALDPDPSRLPVLSFTAPVRVDKNPLLLYVD
jgi:hypothetical protein